VVAISGHSILRRMLSNEDVAVCHCSWRCDEMPVALKNGQTRGNVWGNNSK
jgi:hypothetical protein